MNENRSIKRFITTIINKLDSEKFCYERHLLSNKLQEIKSENFPTLKLLKKNILKVKVEFINIIKKLDKQTLKNLEKIIKPPHFMENIFTMTIEKFLEAQSQYGITKEDANEKLQKDKININNYFDTDEELKIIMS